MSPTGWKPSLTGPLKCYNAADNAKLGYYSSRTVVVDLDATPIQVVAVAAFSEWDKYVKEDPVLVSFGKYKMQYNRATGQNQGTEILRDEMTIAFSDVGKTVVHQDGLTPRNGVVFSVENFDHSHKTLRVEACSKEDGDEMTPGKMSVAFTLGIQGSPCVAAMTASSDTPSASPSALPTARSTTKLPTTSPTSSPTTQEPMSFPTNKGPRIELWLIDVADGSGVMNLPSGGYFQIDTTGSSFPQGFSIEAKQVGSNTAVESVRFFLNSSSWHFKNENIVPYAVAGDNTRTGQYYPWNNYPLGKFRLSAIGYSKNSGRGTAGNPADVTLEVLV
eukprot:scaffold7767_cov149-Amphora_coffeaeformis.AAC.6